jgi:SAM-dependent methyltransferase
MAAVSRVQVDNDGIVAASRSEIVLDVLFDGRRIWSFWLHRDGQSVDSRGRDGATFVPWPGVLRRFLHGTTTLRLVEHVTGDVLFEQEVTLGDAPPGTRIAVVTPKGQPLGLDKSNRLSQTFDTRSEEHVAPLLDSIEVVLGALKEAGVDAFPAYGTLLGAVRGGKLIGHDSDADLGYVSEYTHPVDVIRESFRLQRRLAEMGYEISRYSGAAFKVDVVEGDGMVRGLDVFGGFLHDGHLVLMGEIRAPFKHDWIFPLGSTTLEGRELPAPANTDKFLAATYGPSWRVPDPAFHFETPRSTHRRLNGWFRGTRVNRPEWDRTWSRPFRSGGPSPNPTSLAWWLHEQEKDAALVVDVGCGRGTDIAWLARQGVPGVGLDFSPRGFAAVAEQVADEGLPAELHPFNLGELRHVLGWGAVLARRPGPRVVLARHIAEATDGKGRRNLWRFCEMVLGDGGRLYLEFLMPGEGGAGFARNNFLRMLDPERVVAELKARGGRVVHREELTPGRPVGAETTEKPSPNQTSQQTGGRRICRMVVQWQA